MEPPEAHQERDRGQDDSDLEQGDAQSKAGVLAILVPAFLLPSLRLAPDLFLLELVPMRLTTKALQSRPGPIGLGRPFGQCIDHLAPHVEDLFLRALGLKEGPLVGRLALGQDRLVGGVARQERTERREHGQDRRRDRRDHPLGPIFVRPGLVVFLRGALDPFVWLGTFFHGSDPR